MGTKNSVLKRLAYWIEQWRQILVFKLASQTVSVFTITFCAHVLLIADLTNKGYQYVIIARLQSDPIELHFFQHYHMSRGRILVCLRDLLNLERILQCSSLIKEMLIFGRKIFHLKTRCASPGLRT